MENRATPPDQPLEVAYALITQQGIVMNYDDFLDFSYIVRNLVRPVQAITKTPCMVGEGGVVDLPVDFKFIKSVTTNAYLYNDWKSVQTLGSEDFIVSTNKLGGSKTDFSSTSGKVTGEYVDFRFDGGSTLYVSELLTDREIYVVGTAPYLDEAGSPLLTEKQVIAFAYQTIVMFLEKQLIMGCLKDVNKLKYFKSEASKKTAQSRVPDYITDNQWNELLDVRASHDRKVYNQDFKLQ